MLLFDIPQKETKFVTVAGVKIKLYGELTVTESIVIDIENQKLVVRDASNTEYVLYQLSAWLSVRLGGGSVEDYKNQLSKSRPLIDALWSVFKKESDYKSLEVTEGNEQTKSEILSVNGMESSLNSPITSQAKADLADNSLVVVS